MKTVPGVGKAVELETLENGAKQSKSLYRADLLPAHATLAVAKILHEGAVKYGENNWRRITLDSHLNHAMVHILAFLAGDTQDDHLEHATCRMMMALEKKVTVERKKE